jgi:FAD/FMN-containing dehydrogenase
MEQELFQSALVEVFGSQVSIGEHAAQAAHAALWNGACRTRPCALVSCLSTEDVQRAVQLATERAVPLSVLGGGRHWAGFAVVHGGLVLDLRPMSQVHVDRESRTVTLGGGSLINDVLLELPDDLATVTGAVSSVGYLGLTLGGGYGPLNGRFGLACDTMRSAQVVLANGNVVIASAQENPDLFWALRGGGGNYGVVTAMELELFSVPKVQSATILFPQSSARRSRKPLPMS